MKKKIKKDVAYLKDNKRVGSILGNEKNFMKTSVSYKLA